MASAKREEGKRVSPTSRENSVRDERGGGIRIISTTDRGNKIR